MMTPTAPARPVARDLACQDSTYPAAEIASSTARRVPGATLDEPLRTRETVALDTPARRATSAIVARPLSPGSASCAPDRCDRMT
ncbi:Uncharacterised protein [Actinomyces howellii]|uniref:Uncharacterized protein n=1 Tax=Actinomyces howellii TaxID=52771 RepID=A0A448HFL2_9ACTO|nr:Uncharacterised protein [Actinomyces howellii]